MGEFSIYHWLLVLLVVILLFGARKIPELMRGLGQGIHSFREGLKERPKNSHTESSTGSDVQPK